MNTKARGWPDGSQATSRVPSPAWTETGGLSSGDGPTSQMSWASLSIATSLVAEPHTTGKTVASATPRESVSCSSLGVIVSPSR